MMETLKSHSDELTTEDRIKFEQQRVREQKEEEVQLT
jgi:hypothetical protein